MHERAQEAGFPETEIPELATHPVSVADLPLDVDPRERLFQKIQAFEQDVKRAKMIGEKDASGKVWVEIDPELMDRYFPKGFGPLGYGIQEGIFVTLRDESKKKSQELAANRAIGQFSDPRIKLVGIT